MRTIVLQVQGVTIGTIRTDLMDSQLKNFWGEWRDALHKPDIDTDSYFVSWLKGRVAACHFEEVSPTAIVELG